MAKLEWFLALAGLRFGCCRNVLFNVRDFRQCPGKAGELQWVPDKLWISGLAR